MQEVIGSTPIFSTHPLIRESIFGMLDKQDCSRHETRPAFLCGPVKVCRRIGKATWHDRPSRYRVVGMEVTKGAWRMPWLAEAMKDAASCENPRLGASGH